MSERFLEAFSLIDSSLGESSFVRSGDFDPFLIKGLKYPVRNKSH